MVLGWCVDMLPLAHDFESRSPRANPRHHECPPRTCCCQTRLANQVSRSRLQLLCQHRPRASVARQESLTKRQHHWNAARLPFSPASSFPWCSCPASSLLSSLCHRPARQHVYERCSLGCLHESRTNLFRLGKPVHRRKAKPHGVLLRRLVDATCSKSISCLH